jgi:DNA-binding CsgD family transcriptional regulator
MSNTNSIQEVFFKFLLQYQYHEQDLDYTVLPGHIAALQILSTIGNSGVSIFDIHRKQMAYYSPNYGQLLGYQPADYEAAGHLFFDGKIHPDDKLTLALNGISILKMFNAFSEEEKLSHKLINEYRMLNAEGQYIRLVEQHQILELDKKGQVWLLLGIVDISPDQGADLSVKNQLLNFRSGSFIPFEVPRQPQLELTKREVEILKLVKAGYLSKEISNHLSISVHTVNTHRQRLLEKLGANNSLEAVRFASRFGLVD